MPSRKKGELVLFSSDDPRPLVSYLVERHGLQNILGMLSEQRPGGTVTTKQASKKASKKGGKRGRPKGSKNASKKAAKKGSKKASKKSRKATGPGGAGETGNG
ncbi:MAG TPA: hypothetical protein VK421_02960 [Pyrinomonadaceae bacterium]|nr:hypothetical protein [Pyrinomonadaceae bacterium]